MTRRSGGVRSRSSPPSTKPWPQPHNATAGPDCSTSAASHLRDADRVITAPAFGALTAELRRAEADGHEVESVLPQLVAQRGLDDADDPAAVLHHRLATTTARPVRHDGLTIQRRPPRRIAGLIPEAGGPMTDEYRQALQERAGLIEQRVTVLVRCANNDHEPWLAALGPEPGETGARHAWNAAARMLAAYRDRYGITGGAPLGKDPVSTDAQAVDAARAAHALRHITTSPQIPFRRHDGPRQSHDNGIRF